MAEVLENQVLLQNGLVLTIGKNAALFFWGHFNYGKEDRYKGHKQICILSILS
jgi:hypothetical protein